MTLREALGEYLRDEATATRAIVGTKSFWCYAPQKTTVPYVLFRLASSQPIATHINGAGAPRISTFEVIAHGATQAAAVALAEAVKADTDGLIGVIPSGGTVKVKRCYVSDESDLVSESALADGVFAVGLTLHITT